MFPQVRKRQHGRVPQPVPPGVAPPGRGAVPPLVVNTLELRHERRHEPNAAVLAALAVLVPRGLADLAHHLSEHDLVTKLGTMVLPMRQNALRSVVENARSMVVDDELCWVCVCHDPELLPDLEQHYFNHSVLVIVRVDGAHDDDTRTLRLEGVKWSPNRSRATGRGIVMRSRLSLQVIGPDHLVTTTTSHTV